MRILVAEDDIVSLHLLANALKKWGYDVLSCSSGTDANQLLRREDAPTVAILD